VSFFPRSVHEKYSAFFSNYILSSVHLYKLQYSIYIKIGQCRTNNNVTQAILKANSFPLFMTLHLENRRHDLYFSFLSYHIISNSNKP